MTLQQQEQQLETLEREADAVAMFVSSVDTSRLHMIANLVNEELVMRYQGKPVDRGQLH
jgi:hypothetical protein